MNLSKICKIHGKLHEDDIFIRKNKKYTECRICMRLRSSLFRNKLKKENLEKYKKLKKLSYMRSKNKENHLLLLRIRSKRFRAKNKEKYLSIQKEGAKKRRKNLDNCYVRRLLFPKGKNLWVPDELIQVKRLQIKLKRKIKELQNGN